MRLHRAIRRCSFAPNKRIYTLSCPTCNNLTYTIEKHKIHCSISCGQRKGKFVICTKCKKKTWKIPRDIKRTKKYFCSRNCMFSHSFGKNHPSWKGGSYINYFGYPVLTINKKRILEHRYIMEKHLGRNLSPFEIVHHKNGIKTDNKISNLELWISPHLKGQRISDIIDFICKNYKNDVIQYFRSHSMPQ